MSLIGGMERTLSLEDEINCLRIALSANVRQIEDLRNDLTACQLERDNLRAALKRYGHHRVSCPIAEVFPTREGQAFECTCGFEAASSSIPQRGDHG